MTIATEDQTFLTTFRVLNELVGITIHEIHL